MRPKPIRLFSRAAMLLLALIFAFAGAQTAWAFKAETTDYTINCSNTGIRISGGGSQTDTWIATNGYWVANDSHNLANGITVKPNANVRSQNGSLQTLSSTTFTFTAPSNGNIAITNVVFKSAQNEVSATSHSEPGTTYTVTLASSTYFNGFTLTFGYIKGDCGTNAKWELSKQNGQYTALTISGSGAMNNYGHETVDGLWRTDAPWGYDLTSVTIGNSITSIGDYAFIGCQSLASITVGTGVTTIGTNAFDHCDALTEVTLPASVTSLNQGAFKNCVGLQRIDIQHDGAVSLASNVFQNDNALQYIAFSSPTAALTNTTGNWSGLASKLRVALGDKLFTATNQGGTDAYAITNETDLRNLATAVNGHGHSESIANGKTFRQTGNITLSSTNFEPISIYSEDFLGATYDGGDYTISGLNVSTLTGIDNYGLFGYVKNATVKNIRLVNPTVNVNAAYYGAFIGETNLATVENCVVINPTIQGSNTKRGAIIGRIDNSTLQNLYFCDGNYNDAIGFVHSGSSGTNVARARRVTLGSGIANVTPTATDMDNGFVYNSERYYREGLELTLTSNLSATGYHIIYKAGSNTLTGNTYTVNSTDGDVTLTAEQMITTYTITYNLNGGTLVTDKNSYTIESSDITLDKPTRDGFIFDGWYDNAGLTGEAVKTIAHGSMGNKEYWAKWLLTYIDADGQLKETASYTVLTGSESTSDTNLFSGWYVVTGNVSYSGSLCCVRDLIGNMHLVLCDGASLTINSSDYAIDAYNLTIYGQTQGTGTLNANSTNNTCIYAEYDNITINGGNVSATSSDGTGLCAQTGNITINSGNVEASGDYGIYASQGNVTINGGNVEASGNVYGICARKTITLGWTNASDYIHASSYKTYIGTLKIADGQSLYNGNEVLSGTITDMSKLDGKTLMGVDVLQDAATNDVAALATRLNGKQTNVALSGRTLTKDGNWNTLCLPFSMTAAQIAASPLAGATIKEMAMTSNLDANGVLTLNFSTVTAIEAGTPYIIKWTTTGDDIVNPVFSNVTISSTTPTAVVSNDKKVTFVGQYSPFSIVSSGATGDNEGNKNEILLMTKGNKIGYSKNPRTLNCFRCHFYVPTNGGQQAHSIEVDFGEGEATALSEELRVKSEECNATLRSLVEELTGSWYSLDGRKLEGKPTAKGMYIVNGRKVIIK